jgi:lipopolysaccharide/colanic/teichoic acid biosynthesis glycosyltransferase
MYFPYGKRLFDIVLSGLTLLIFSPILTLVCLLIYLDDKGPPFYFQERIGKNFKPFRLIKFRSMTVKQELTDNQFDAGDTSRVTRVGKALRTTKIDELPELFNILRGDMSFVGPRPEVRQYVKLFPDNYTKVLKVRPGLSDMASIKYANEEEILAVQPDPDSYYRSVILPDKLHLAEHYVNVVTLKTDMLVIINTLKTLCNKIGFKERTAHLNQERERNDKQGR